MSSAYVSHASLTCRQSAATRAACRALAGSPSGYSAVSIEKTKSAMFPPTNRPPRTAVMADHARTDSLGRVSEEITCRKIGKRRAYLRRGLLLEQVQGVDPHLNQPPAEVRYGESFHPRIEPELVQAPLTAADHLEQPVFAFRLDRERRDFLLSLTHSPLKTAYLTFQNAFVAFHLTSLGG